MTEVDIRYHNAQEARRQVCLRVSGCLVDEQGGKRITARGMARAATVQHHVVGGKGSIEEVSGIDDHVGVDSMIAVPHGQGRYRWYTKFEPFAPLYQHMYVRS